MACLWPWSAVYGADVRLSIDAVSASPNYELTRDENDLAQLVDGERSSFPIWTNRNSVGWQNKTPVVLKGSVLRNGRTEPVVGLNVFTAKGEYAGVYPPMRTDVYCGSDGRGWRHSAVSTPDVELFPDRSAVTIPIALDSPCSDSLAVIFHFNGAFLMLDEISPVVGSLPEGVTKTEARMVIAAGQLIDDSQSRFKKNLESNQNQWLGRYIEANEITDAQAWLSQPWSSLEMQSVTPEVTAVQDLAILGSKSWSSDYVVGLLNGSAREQEFRLAWQAEAVKKRDVFMVLGVVAANGKTVFDPLRPVAEEGITIPPRSMAYLLIRESASASYAQVVTVTSNLGFRRELQVNVEMLSGLSDEGQPAPAVVAWSYLSDSPIWRESNRTELISLLKGAGVNVFVVHPMNVPVPGAHGEWTRTGRALREELRAYKGAGTVLIYLAWDERLKSASDERLRRDVKVWAARLIKVMSETGYTFDDWALYPVDEPIGTDYELIAKVGRWIKEEDARVRIYSNPGQLDFRDVLPGSGLQSAAAVVDIWQPLVGNVSRLIRPVVSRGGGQKWWIYDVVRQPAKATSPNCYRRLGWEAVRSNATGIGFWSFSDTGRSSAWDDYDGIRPDWAVVYEEPDGAVTVSRRWEAFSQGIRDYRALKNCGLVQNQESITYDSCKRFESALSETFSVLSCK